MNRITLLLLSLLCILLLASCQSTPDKPVEPPPAPVLPPPPAKPEPTLVLDSLNDIILALQDGDEAIAARSLQAMLEQGRNQNIANKLLQQIQTDPEQLLGAEHETITVMAGDTLSMLAQQHLGDPLMFYALARYNNIEIPRLLTRGQSLIIPRNYDRGGNSLSGPEQRSEQERLATFLIASGERREGWQTLLQAALDQQLSASGQQQLFTLSQELAEASLAAQRGDEAITTLQSARAAFTDDARGRQIEKFLLRTRARAKLQQSALASANNDLATAWQLAAEAAAIDPDFPAAGTAAASLKSNLVQQLHEQALRHWRDREVAQSISLWEQLLAVQADFAPASVYLQRAREMAARLKQSQNEQ